MSGILGIGDEVQAEVCGMSCSVNSFLGSGGQGEVYKVSLQGTPLAMKWYYPEWATIGQQEALQQLIKKGPPSPMFLWPVDIVAKPGVPGFGYLMPLRDSRFRSGIELIRKKVDPPFRIIATIGYNLAQAFLQLHSQGLAYRDINLGNFFLDPATGDVLICDLDNVGIDGKPHNQVGGVIEFMAPEIIRGEAYPSASTDQHSLAILLFYMLMMAHPLEGKKEASQGILTPQAKAQLYGFDPVYVAHPTNDSNRPVRGRHDNLIAFWSLYPWYLKKLFEKSFVGGLRDPSSRVRESEWRAAMIQLRDAVIYCGNCGTENILPLKDETTLSDRVVACWSCRRTVILPFYLHLGTRLLALNHDTVVYAHHVDPQSLYDFVTAVAVVTQHPTNPSVWGLKNVTGGCWDAKDAAGAVLAIEPGKSIKLSHGTSIKFGTCSGTILYAHTASPT